jgi:gliding motility-associated-like protein
MKKFLLLFVFTTSSFFTFSQISPVGNSGSSITQYTNGVPNDSIFIWCNEGINIEAGSLTASTVAGIAPYTFNWFYHNEITSSWEPYTSTTGNTSTLTQLPSDGYRVEIFDSQNTLVGCYVSWVWNLNVDLNLDNTPTACNAADFDANISVVGDFVYYNPPPPESIINANTTITVCFSAVHTYVSDLAFYLVGPASCGSPRILLSPNPGANGQGGVCNSNYNVNNLCFTTSPSANFNPCNQLSCGFLGLSTNCLSNYTGTYSSYGPNNNQTPINWSQLYGCNAAEGGWAVQIYDCIGQDVGSLTNATISFSNLNAPCGGQTSIVYSSGSINSAINDNSCTPQTASIFQVPPSTTLTTPIVDTASINYNWTSNVSTNIPNPNIGATVSLDSLPSGSTTFYLNVDVEFANSTCTFSDSTIFTNTCCSSIADAGNDTSFCTGGNTILGTPAIAGFNYVWSPTTGLSNPNIAQPTLNITNNTSSVQTFTYTVQVFNPAEGNCFTADEVEITIYPLPFVDAGIYQNQCEYNSVINLTGTPVGGIFTGNGVSGYIFNPNSASIGANIVTYLYTDSNGCSNTTTTSINVFPRPVVSHNTIANQCITNTTFNLTGGNPAGGYYFGNGVNNNQFNPQITGLGSHTINYVFTSPEGCSDTIDVVVNVTPLPLVDFPNPSGVCSNDTPFILNNGNPSGGTYSGNGVSNNTFNPSTAGAGTYQLTYTFTDNNNCTNSDIATIVVNQAPIITFNTPPLICINDSAILLDFALPTNGDFSGNGISNNYINPSITGSGNNTVSYTFTDVNNCTSVANFNLTIENIVASFTPDPSIGIVPLTVNFSNFSENGDSYLWNFGDGNTDSIFNPSHQYIQQGEYTATLIATSANGCEDSMQYTITVEEYLFIVPNVFSPNGDGLNDEFKVSLSGYNFVSGEIYNKWGNKLFNWEDINSGWNGKVKSEDASDGTYLYIVIIEDLMGNKITKNGTLNLFR